MRLPPHSLVVSGTAASILGTVCGTLLLALAGFSGDVRTVTTVLGATAAISLYGVVVAMPFVFLYGAPIYALLKRFGAANFVTAAVVGALPGAAWVLWTRGSWVDPALWNGTLIGIIFCRLRARAEAAVRQ